MKFYFFILICLFSLQVYSQTPKDNYLQAEELYYSGDYSSAITKLNTVQSSLGKSNAVIEQLRVKCYFEQEEWDKTEKHLKKFFSYKASKELSDEMLDYAQRIQDRTFKAIQDEIGEDNKKSEQVLSSIATSINTQIKTIEKENDNIRKAAKHEYEINELASSLKASIESDIDDFLFLEKGKPYVITSRKNLTSSSSERAVLIFYGDEYIIYTVPSVNITKRLYKDIVSFTSSDAQSGDVLIKQKIKRYGTKKEMTFKKSIHYSNIFLGGWGDELIWTKGQQYLEFDEELYYYYYYNTLHCDVELNTSFSKHYYNPYIETGTISKTIDYELVKDYSLSEKLKAAGVVNKTSYTLSNPEVLKITLEPSSNIKMLFPEKRIKYQMVDKIKGKYVNQNVEHKGEFLYFVPKTKANHYGYIQYGTSYPKSNFLSSITGLNNSYRMSQSIFSSIYKTFSKSVGNGTKRYFTSTDYRSLFETIPTIIEGEEVSIKRPIADLSNTKREVEVVDSKVYSIAYKKPEFVGGKSALNKYITDNIVYDEKWKPYGLQGKILIDFIVGKDGSIRDVKCNMDMMSSMDVLMLSDEAIRIVKNMPKWIPAEKDGKQISVKMKIPITFMLQ